MLNQNAIWHLCDFLVYLMNNLSFIAHEHIMDLIKWLVLIRLMLLQIYLFYLTLHLTMYKLAHIVGLFVMLFFNFLLHFPLHLNLCKLILYYNMYTLNYH